jgi:hypothetical protein
MYKVSLFRIITTNPFLYNEYMIIKMGKRGRRFTLVFCIHHRKVRQSYLPRIRRRREQVILEDWGNTGVGICLGDQQGKHTGLCIRIT